MEKPYRIHVTDISKAIYFLEKELIPACEEGTGIRITISNQTIAHVILYLNAKEIVVYDVEEVIV